MKQSDPKSYFPKNYVESRRGFIEQIKAISSPCEHGSWNVPSTTHDDLAVDYAWLPPLKRPKNLFVLISGIHGSETYAGSAILNLFIQEILPQMNRDDLGIFMVHAMNPFGFKNHRRCTESNVNLNRNFSVSGDLFNRKNPESKRLHDLFLNRSAVTSHQSKLVGSLRKQNQKVFFNDVPLDHIIKSVSPGQFEHPDNLEYGGTCSEPQTQALIDKMKQLMPDFENVVAFDLHTGLGHRGRLHLLTDGDKKTLNPELFAQIFKPQQDHSIYTFTPADEEGFYPVHGATNSMFADLSQTTQKVCAVTLEFGTLGHSPEQQIEDLNYSIADHEGHHYGFADEKLKKEILAVTLSRSYPDDDQWRKSILTAAEGLLNLVAIRFK